MTNKQIFIMAQGKGSRWTYDDRTGYLPPATHKQLVMIGDEPIIVRTLRQLHERLGFGKENIIVVADGDYFFQHIQNHAGLMTYREPVGTILNGIWMSKDFWLASNRIIFLLGDVVFSNEAIDKILSNNSEVATFYGRKGMNVVTGKSAKEIFALEIPTDLYVKDFIISELYSYWNKGLGTKLWDLYNYVDMDFVKINDYTDDIDSPQEYQQFHETLERLAIEDDERLYENRTISE